MSMYTGFADIYDEFMDDFDYPAWARYYQSLLLMASRPVKTIAECACGTGSMTSELVQLGYSVTASDLSGEMLMVASKKLRSKGLQASVAQMDMCAFSLPRRVDAVISACDGVNYLTSASRVKAFFSAAYTALEPGGALVFDISSRNKLEEEMGDAFFGEERESAAYLWENSLDRKSHLVTMDITFFIRSQQDLYRRIQETHVQRAHSEEEIRRWLHECGFSEVHVFGDLTHTPPKPNEQRLHFAAIKNPEDKSVSYGK